MARSRRRLATTFAGQSPRERDALVAAPPGEVTVVERPDGARVWTTVAGEGPTVVLTHGYGLRTASWNLVATALVDRGHRVIGLDWRAHGESTTGDVEVTTECLVGDLVAVLEHHDVHDAVLVGHSTGGYVSIATLVEHPEVADRLRGLVLVASLAGEVLTDEPDGLSGLHRSISRGIGRRLAGNEPLRLLFGGVLRGLHLEPTVAEVFLDEFTDASHVALVRLLRDLAGNSYYDRLGEIALPAVVVCGQEDTTTPPDHSRALGDGIPDARVVWVPGAGHLLTWQHPVDVVEAIESLVPGRTSSSDVHEDPPATALLVLNPASGTHDPDETESVVVGALEEGGIDVEVRRTEGAGDARRWAAEAATDGASVDLVVVAGGDGSVREVVSGVVDGGRDVPVAIIPMGTANLMARALGVPHDDVAAAAAVAASGRRRRIDVLHLVDRDEHAVLMVGGGFDAQLIEDSTRGLKNVLGPLAYVVSGVRNAFQLRDVQVELELDGNARRRRAHSVLCLNVGRIGESIVVDRDIEPDDGRLHVGVVGRPRPWDVVSTAVQLVVGDRDEHASIEWARGRRLRLEADPALDVQVDGDLVGETPVEIELLEGAVRVVVPRASDADAGRGD